MENQAVNPQEKLVEDILEVNRDAKLFTVEHALKEAGDMNRYQFNLFVFLTIHWMLFAFLLMGQALLFSPPEFLCAPTTDPTNYTSCTADSEHCDAANFYIKIAPGYEKTLPATFGIYCDKAWLKSLAQACFFASGAIATLVVAYICDKYGRRTTLLITYIIGAIALLAAGLSPNFVFFALCLFIAGAGVNPYLSFTFVILSESGGEAYRQIATVSVLYFWTFGEMLTGLIVWAFNNNWRPLMIYCLGVPLCLSIIVYCWIYESPKFLISKGEYGKAKEVICKIAQKNKRSLGNFEFIEENRTSLKMSSEKTTVSTSKQKIYGYGDLFRYGSLRVVTFGGSVLYFVTQYIYFGCIFAINNLGGNIYINCFLLGLSEFLGYIVSIPVIKYVKRKIAFSVSFLLSGIAALAFIFLTIPSECQNSDEGCFQKSFGVILGMITRLMISISYLLIYLYLNELYPTPVRSLGTGLCTFIGRFGSIIAPILVYVLSSIGINPWISFGVFGIIAAIVSLFMRETFGIPLENEIEEEKTIDDNSSAKKNDDNYSTT